MTPRVWNDWISKFLSARGLQEPDGRALWAYRVSEEEFQEIREIEKKLVWRQFDIPYDDRVMIFTLHATELWRREYAGGPWTWDILMPHFGMPEDLQDYARQLVGHGARNWKIQTVKNRQGRQYVATLFVNSGLPTQLIAQEHGSKIEELVLKSIQRGFRFPDEADVLNGVEHFKSILPDTLAAQPSFINMIGQWVLAIVSLVRENRLNKATNPILQLNEVEPNWANRLPFEVSGEEMSALLERLLKQSAVYVPEERNFVSSFMGIRPLNKNEWQPVLEFKFLHVVSRSVIKEYIRSDDLTDDYSLYLKGGFGRILLARLISSPFLQHNFEINGQTDQAIRYGSEALSEMSFELEDQFGRTFGLSIDISPFSIGARPALFSERINGPIRLDGYGRVSTEKSEGFIVTHEPLEELNEQTKITPVGYLRGFEEQKVYRIEGSVGVGLGIDRFVIRTGDRSKRAEFFGFFFEDLIDAFDPSVQVLSTESIESNLSRDFDYDWGRSTTSGIGDLRVFDITRSPKELVWKERILRTDGEPSIEVESEGGKQLVRLDNIPYRSVYVENPETQTELVTESIPEGFKFSVDELTVKPVRITLLLEDHKEWSFSIVPRLHGALVTLDNQIVDSCSISQLYSANLNLVMTDYQYYLEDDLTVTARLTMMTSSFKRLAIAECRLGELDPRSSTFSCSLAKLAGVVIRFFKSRSATNDLINLEFLVGGNDQLELMSEIFRIYQFSAHPVLTFGALDGGMLNFELDAKALNGDSYDCGFKVVSAISEKLIAQTDSVEGQLFKVDAEFLRNEGFICIPLDSYVSPIVQLPELGGDHKQIPDISDRLGFFSSRGSVDKVSAIMQFLCEKFTHPSWDHINAIWNNSKLLSAKSHPFWGTIAYHKYPSYVISRIALSDKGGLVDSISQFWDFFSAVGIIWQAVTMSDWSKAVDQGNAYIKIDHPVISKLDDEVSQSLVNKTLETFLTKLRSRSHHMESVADVLAKQWGLGKPVDWLEAKGKFELVINQRIEGIRHCLVLVMQDLAKSTNQIVLIDDKTTRFTAVQFCNNLFGSDHSGGRLKALFGSRGPGVDSGLPALQLFLMLKAMISYAAARDEQLLLYKLLDEDETALGIKFNLAALDLESSQALSRFCNEVFQYAYLTKTMRISVPSIRNHVRPGGRVVKKAVRPESSGSTGINVPQQDGLNQKKLDALLRRHLRISNRNANNNNDDVDG